MTRTEMKAHLAPPGLRAHRRLDQAVPRAGGGGGHQAREARRRGQARPPHPLLINFNVRVLKDGLKRLVW